MENTQIMPFSYGTKSVRAVLIENEPWFVAADICKILEIQNPTDAIKSLDEDEYTRFNLGYSDDEFNTLRDSDGNGPGNPNVNIISESGLYTLILRSNKPQAKPFRRWVTREVLPTIRKTGSYSVIEEEESIPMDSGPAAISIPRLEEAARGIKAAMIMARAFGYKHNTARQYASAMVKRITGIDSLSLMNAPVEVDNGRRSLPDRSEEVEKLILRFFEDRCEEDQNARTGTTWLYESFAAWHREEMDEDVPSHREFGLVVGKYFRKQKIKGLVVYKNIKLKEA